jgi:Fibronectin type III domain
VILAWNASISTNVVGYNVYYGVASGVYDNKISVVGSTNATVTGLVPGITYYFAATAVDTFGDESPFSNETSYAPGVPRLQVRAAPGGQFILTVSGLIGHTYEIEATQDFKAWTIVGAVTPGTSGSVEFTDTNAASCPQRFYRTLEIH